MEILTDLKTKSFYDKIFKCLSTWEVNTHLNSLTPNPLHSNL
jgi:hypothetical protein